MHSLVSRPSTPRKNTVSDKKKLVVFTYLGMRLGMQL